MLEEVEEEDGETGNRQGDRERWRGQRSALQGRVLFSPRTNIILCYQKP